MALFSKLFEGEAHPYDLKGRWYKITAEGGHLIANKSDLPLIEGTSGSNLTVQINVTNSLACADFKFMKTKAVTGTASSPNSWSERVNGNIVFYVPQAITDFVLYVYLVKI